MNSKFYIARIPRSNLYIKNTTHLNDSFINQWKIFEELLLKKNEPTNKAVVFFNQDWVKQNENGKYISINDFPTQKISQQTFIKLCFEHEGRSQHFYLLLNNHEDGCFYLSEHPDDLILVNKSIASNSKETIESLRFAKDLLYSNKVRYCVKPIMYPELWEKYKNHEKLDWKAEDICAEKDRSDFNKLSKAEKHCLKEVLAFFACSDSIVMENLENNFINECTILEANMFYTFQSRIEQVHAEAYADMIDGLIDDPIEKQNLYDSVQKHPIIKKKANWMKRYMEKEENETNIFNTSYPKRLLSFACTEGIQFSSSFAYILYFKSKGTMKQITLGNELISKDEGLHRDFAEKIGNLIFAIMPSQEEAHSIIKESVNLEIEHVRHSIPLKLPGLNREMMEIYVKNTANILSVNMGYDIIYENVYNPFDWMEIQSQTIKSNFFEQKSSEYKESNVQIDWEKVDNSKDSDDQDSSEEEEEYFNDECAEWSDEDEQEDESIFTNECFKKMKQKTGSNELEDTYMYNTIMKNQIKSF